jgi:hypothetical protein
MTWLPAPSDVVVSTAEPPLTITVPRLLVCDVVEPEGVNTSVKVTKPAGMVGCPVLGLLTLTVAVMVTVWPTAALLGEASTVVVVSALPTV